MKLEEIESLLDKITPLPWLDYCISTGESWEREYRINNPEIGVDIARCGNDYTFSKSDSVFIAAAPTIIKGLVERVRKLEDFAGSVVLGDDNCTSEDEASDLLCDFAMDARKILKEAGR